MATERPGESCIELYTPTPSVTAGHCGYDGPSENGTFMANRVTSPFVDGCSAGGMLRRARAGLRPRAVSFVCARDQRAWQIGHHVVPRASITRRRNSAPQRSHGSPERP